jgi:hypothetical protein
MNRYTEKQIYDLFMVIQADSNIPYQLVKMFISKDSNFITNDIKLCKDDTEVYQKIKSFRYTKTSNNRPDKILKGKIKKLRDIIFEAPLKMVPLYINDDLLSSISKWRLKNAL